LHISFLSLKIPALSTEESDSEKQISPYINYHLLSSFPFNTEYAGKSSLQKIKGRPVWAALPSEKFKFH